MKALTRLLVPTGLVLLLATIAPAHATTTLSLSFTGAWVQTTGFGLPVVTHNVANFALGSTVCAATMVRVSKPDTGPVVDPMCAIQAAGIVMGACGMATGNGTGIINAGMSTFNIVFTFTVEGSTATLTGVIQRTNGSQAGQLAAELELVPDPSGGSCATKTAARFNVVGNVEAVLL